VTANLSSTGVDRPAGRFARDSAVTRMGPNRYGAGVDPGWAVIDDAAPNGGYLMAIAARAMADAAGRPHPLSVTAHFLAACQPGPVEITTDVHRRGGRHATVSATLSQAGAPMVTALGVFTDLSAASGPSRDVLPAPPLAPMDSCVTTGAGGGSGDQGRRPAPPPIFQRFEHRMDPATLGFADGKPSGAGAMGGYLRLADNEDLDPFGLLVVADCYPPALFNLTGLPVGWAPTIELTVQVRAVPAPGWLSAWFTTSAVTDGYLEEDGQVRDSSGRLVVLSRQLALAPRP